VHPQQAAVSHPARSETVRASSKQISGDRTTLFHSTSSQTAQSAVHADNLPLQMNLVHGKERSPRSSAARKTISKLTDTEVLGIDLEPEKPQHSLEDSSQQCDDVEVIMSGHSTVGLGRHTECEYHSIGLQPVGTQRPQFTPGPEQVLRDELTEQYPRSFWHNALDIEIRPRDAVDLQQAQIDICPYAAAIQSQDEDRMHGPASRSDKVTHREEKDSVTVTQRSRDTDLLQDMSPATYIHTVGEQMTVGSTSPIFADSLAETLQSLSNEKPERHHTMVNHASSPRSVARWHIPHQMGRPASRSRICDVGLELFRSKSMDFADVQHDCWLVHSHSDMNIISPRRSCRQRRHLAQPVSADSSLSKSDQELLGSTSALFEDLLPIFRDLPLFSSSLDGSDSETEEEKFAGGRFGQFENFLPLYCALPSVPRSDEKRQEHAIKDPAVSIVISDETSYGDGVKMDNQHIESDLSFGQMATKTDLCQPSVAPTDECKSHRNALECDKNNAVERAQSMDSITYVFVGHGASSLEAVGNDRPGMVRFLSELSSYPHEDTANMRQLMPEHSHAYGFLTESSSDNCLLSADTQRFMPSQRSLSCTDLNEQTAGSDSINLTSDVSKVGCDQMPQYLEFDRNECGAQTSDEVGLLKRAVSLPASEHSKFMIQTSSCSNGSHAIHSHAGQPLLAVSSVGSQWLEAEPQTPEDCQLSQEDGGYIDWSPSSDNEPAGIGRQLMHDEKSRTVMPDHNGHQMQFDTLEVPGNHVSSVDELLQGNEQSNILCKEAQWSDDGSSHKVTKKNYTVQNWPRVGTSPRTYSTQSLPGWLDDQGQFSSALVSRSSSSRTIETQTYPEMRVIETQTSDSREACATQMANLMDRTDMESESQITVPMDVRLTASSTASSQELRTPLVIELWSPSAGIVTSQLLSSVSSTTPVIATSCALLQSPSHPTVGRVHSSFTDPSVTASNDAAADYLHASHKVDRWSYRPSEKALSTTDLSHSHTRSAAFNLQYEHGSRTAEEGTTRSTHSPLPGENIPSSGINLLGYCVPFQTAHAGTSVTSPSLVASDICSRQTPFNDERLLVVKGRNLQHSVTLPTSIHLGLSSGNVTCEDIIAQSPCVSCHETWLSNYSTMQTPRNSLSPTSSSDLKVTRIQDSLQRRSPEAEKRKLKVDKILEKYRMKNAKHVVPVGNESSGASPQYDSHARLSQSAGRSLASSSFSQANDSGIVESRHSLSPLTRTLLGYSDASCWDKSTVTGKRSATGWYNELERLRRERQHIIDMLTHEVIPSKIQVELTEAHLNYLIGQTDTLLQHADESSLVSHHHHVLGADFHTFCRARLEASKTHIESQIQQLEGIGKEADMRTAQLAANFNSNDLGDEVADVRENTTPKLRYSTDFPVSHQYSRTWTPSQREQFLLGIRREVVSATASHPVTPVHTDSSRSHTRSSRCLWPNKGHLSAHSSAVHLGPNDSIHEEEAEWCPSSLAATPAASLQHLDRHRYSVIAPSVDSEINTLLAECREARQRARVEIGRAMDVMQRTSPWASSPLSSDRYFTAYVIIWYIFFYSHSY